MVVLFNLNLLLIRYLAIDLGNGRVTEGLIFQWPWDSLETALKKRRFIKFE